MIYTEVEGQEGFRLEVGLPVPDDTPAVGAATVRDVPARRVASLVYTGGLAHIGRAHDMLMEGARDLGLEGAGEYSERYHAFGGPGAPTNVTQVMTTLR
jgi:effector-binding domain-containing protein